MYSRGYSMQSSVVGSDWASDFITSASGSEEEDRGGSRGRQRDRDHGRVLTEDNTDLSSDYSWTNSEGTDFTIDDMKDKTDNLKRSLTMTSHLTSFGSESSDQSGESHRSRGSFKVFGIQRRGLKLTMGKISRLTMPKALRSSGSGGGSGSINSERDPGLRPLGLFSSNRGLSKANLEKQEAREREREEQEALRLAALEKLAAAIEDTHHQVPNLPVPNEYSPSSADSS
ncbi:unnamed protein product, partial [Discosporangium mesarthrocarpum]